MFQDRDAQKMQWINRFVEELKNDKWVLPALKQIRDICQLFNEVCLKRNQFDSLLAIYVMVAKLWNISITNTNLNK